MKEQYRQAAIDALSRFPDGETERKLREIAGLSGSKFGPILSLLIREGVAEACEITKQNHQTYDGYRLTKSHWDSVGHTGTVPLSQ